VNANDLKGVPVDWIVTAMNTAADRMIDVHWHQPERAFAAIGETLWWACSLDESLSKSFGDRYRHARSKDSYIESLILGLRYARNRYSHAVRLADHVEVTAVVGSNWIGGYEANWKWRDLPATDRSRRDSVAYAERLAQQDVKQALINALSFLRWAAAEFS
jgi:hypothetical protein